MCESIPFIPTPKQRSYSPISTARAACRRQWRRAWACGIASSMGLNWVASLRAISLAIRSGQKPVPRDGLQDRPVFQPRSTSQAA
ncbi:MAG: hypothetical protein ACI9GK_000152 [Devosia sp.]|jgi:hypothetical protein